MLRHRRHPRTQWRPRQSPPLDQGQGGAQADPASYASSVSQGLGGVAGGGGRRAGGWHGGAGEDGGKRFGLRQDGRVVGAALGCSHGDSGRGDGSGCAAAG